MKNLSLFLLLCLLFAACAKDEDKEPILVTDIVMPSQTSFNPGDKVTIKAQGFQPDDDIMFEIYWPLPDQPALNYQGYARGVSPVMVEQTATSITFLAPGHYPASTTKILLRRAGDIMTLGEIAVSNGQAPEEFQLYGIVNSHSGTGHDNCIEHVKLTDGSPKNIMKLTEDQKDFSCIVNAPESQRLCGIQTKDGVRKVYCYDLSMRYWQDMGLENILTLCNNANGSITAVRQISPNEVVLASVATSDYTRSQMPSTGYRYELPANIKPESLTGYPGVQVGTDQLLFSADNGNNSFTPVVLQGGSNKVHVGEQIQATALIPFWTIIDRKDNGTTKYVRTGGYAVVKTDAQTQTELRLWDQATLTLQEPFATFPNPARSIAMLAEDTETLKLYVLFDTNRGGRLIYAYDLASKDWQSVPGIGYPYSEIVMAR